MSRDEMKKYVEVLMRDSKPWKSMKLIVLGNGRIGKTTLLKSFNQILHPNEKVISTALLFSFPHTNQQDDSIESTVGVDCHTLNIADGEVTVWDFAGQQEYTVTHQFFLSTEVCISYFRCMK